MLKTQQSRGFQDDGRTQQAGWNNDKRAQTLDQPIRTVQGWRALAPAIQDEQLMPDQDGFGDYATQSARPY